MRTGATVVGEALVDLVAAPGRPGGYLAHPGGSPYNVAITLARLGVPTALVARVGRDGFGRLLADKARASGVDLRGFESVEQPTTLAVAGLDGAGRADYDFYLDGTAALGWDDALVDLVPPPGILHIGSLASWLPPSGPRVLAMQRRAHQRGDVLVSYDPNVRPALTGSAGCQAAELSIAAAHVVKASDEDAAFLHPDLPPDAVARRWTGLGASLVVITSGADGATAFGAHGELARAAGLAVDVVDTVGAGDAFSGGLLAALAGSALGSPDRLQAAVAAADERIAAALERAVLVSALTCGRPGADPPTRADLDARSAT